MSTTELAPSLRHRKSILSPKLDSEVELLHTNQRKTAKQRWSTCIAFLFKRSKSKSSSSGTETMEHENDFDILDDNGIDCDYNNDENHNDGDNDKNSKIKPNDQHDFISLVSQSQHRQPGSDTESDSQYEESIKEKSIYHYASSLPPTPVSSLSPPPRHAMTRQNRTRSLTPLDHTYTDLPSSFSSTPTLPSCMIATSFPPSLPMTLPLIHYDHTPTSITNHGITNATSQVDKSINNNNITCNPRPRQHRHKLQRAVLRLSLDVDHNRHSYTSSVHTLDSSDDATRCNNDSTINNHHCRRSCLLDEGAVTITDHQHRHHSCNTYCSKNVLDSNSNISDDNGNGQINLDHDLQEWVKACQGSQQTHSPMSYSDSPRKQHREDANDRLYHRLGQDKAQYDAVVSSTLYHHHHRRHATDDQVLSCHMLTPTSPTNSNITTSVDPYIDTPPSSAHISLSHFPSSPHSYKPLSSYIDSLHL